MEEVKIMGALFNYVSTIGAPKIMKIKNGIFANNHIAYFHNKL